MSSFDDVLSSPPTRKFYHQGRATRGTSRPTAATMIQRFASRTEQDHSAPRSSKSLNARQPFQQKFGGSSPLGSPHLAADKSCPLERVARPKSATALTTILLYAQPSRLVTDCRLGRIAGWRRLSDCGRRSRLPHADVRSVRLGESLFSADPRRKLGVAWGNNGGTALCGADVVAAPSIAP